MHSQNAIPEPETANGATMLRSGDLVLTSKYRIEELVGKGAFAAVYRATHLELNVPRAIKVLRLDAPGVGSTTFNDYRERYRQEFQIAARLDQANVIKVYDLVEELGTLYAVLEYAAGGSVKDLIAKEGALPVERAVQILLDCATGLEALHEKLGVIHRDIKPSNILLDADGRAKIADLGLAQVGGGQSSMRSELGSTAGMHPGTALYRSPEHNSWEPLTPTSDVYSLGCIAFEMLTGQVWKQVMHKAARVRDLRPDMPEWLDTIVMRMVSDVPGLRVTDSTNPQKRYVTMRAIATALHHGMEQAPRPDPKAKDVAQQKAEEEAQRRAKESARLAREAKWRKVWITGIAVFVVLILGFWWVPSNWNIFVLSVPTQNVPTVTQIAFTSPIVVTGTPTLVSTETPHPTPTALVATSTQVPSAIPTPTKTATLRPTATLTKAPTITPIGSGVVKVKRVIRSSSFDIPFQDPFVIWGYNAAYQNGGITLIGINTSGNPLLSSFLAANFTSEPDSAIIVRFKTENLNVGAIWLQSGDWGTSSWRSFSLSPSMNASAWNIHSGDVVGSDSRPRIVSQVPLPKSDTWYYVMLRVRPQGLVEGEFWEADNPSNRFKYSQQVGQDWVAHKFNFQVGVNDGKIVVDEFQEVELAE